MNVLVELLNERLAVATSERDEAIEKKRDLAIENLRLVAERDALAARNKSWEKSMGERVKQANALMDERDALQALVNEATGMLRSIPAPDPYTRRGHVWDRLLARLDAAAKADQ